MDEEPEHARLIDDIAKCMVGSGNDPKDCLIIIAEAGTCTHEILSAISGDAKVFCSNVCGGGFARTIIQKLKKMPDAAEARSEMGIPEVCDRLFEEADRRYAIPVVIVGRDKSTGLLANWVPDPDSLS